MSGGLQDPFVIRTRAAFRSLHGLSEEPSGAEYDARGDDRARMHRVLGLWLMHRGGGLEVLGHGVSRSACLGREAVRISEALAARGCCARLVKGPALEAQAWPEQGIRHFDDLDFRLSRGDFRVALEVLAELGYKPLQEGQAYVFNLWNYGWGVAFRNLEGQYIELNHRMFPPHFPWPHALDMATPGIWAEVSIDGDRIGAPSPPLHLLLSAAHLVWHGWERLVWLCDVAGLAVRHGGVYEEARRLAKGHHFLTVALDSACAVSQRLFGPLPGLPSLAHVPDSMIADAILQILRDTPGVPVSEQRRIQRSMMTPVERLRFEWLRLATPGEPDFRQCPLGQRSAPLYWGLRPGFGVVRRLKPVLRASLWGKAERGTG